MRSVIFRTRLFSFLFVSLFVFSVLIIRLLYLQVFQYQFYSKVADEQHTVTIELEPRRGAIFDRNMRVLALNLNAYSVFANPRDVKDKDGTAAALASALALDKEAVKSKLSKNKGFVWIKRKLNRDEYLTVRNLKLKGIDTIKESKRYYPNKSLACHVIGTADIDNNGLEGLELKYDKFLKGESGYFVAARDARRKILELYKNSYVPPKNGANLILSIDEVIQSIAEKELKKSFEKHNAKGASIVVMDPINGDVLALANFPNYDLNELNKRPIEAIRNRAVNDFNEPGSVFKIVAASAAIETGVVKFEDKFFCENGEWHIGRRILHDHNPHGTLTFKQVIEMSSNIGTCKVASLFGANIMYKYMRSFGIYEKTGIDLPGEVVGINRPVNKWSKVSMLAIPMGQEVTTTAMQLTCAIAAIADNGLIVRPRVVKEVVSPSGDVIKENSPKVVRRAIEPATAAKMRVILKGVVYNGTGKKARMEDFTCGGKTGTAQKIEPNGTYSHSKFVGSFIGFAPAEKPVIAIVVCVDEPHPVYFGGDVAAPVFRNVADQTLKYLSAKGIKKVM